MVEKLLAVADPATGPALYAFSLGLVASVNPCGFPLLPAYLCLFVEDDRHLGWAQRTARGLVAGASVTAGFVLVFGVLGLVIESGVQVLLRWVPWVMIPLGALLVVLGLLSVIGRLPRLSLPRPAVGGRRGVVGMIGFGVAYAVASLSCALPLFLAGVAGSFNHLGLVDGSVTVVAYALGMGLFLIVASLVVAHAGAPAIRRVRPLSRFVPAVAGSVLMAVGVYLVYYWVSYLIDPVSTPVLVRGVEGLQASVSNWLASSARLVGLVLGTVVVAACGLLARWSRRTRPGSPPQVSSDTRKQLGSIEP